MLLGPVSGSFLTAQLRLHPERLLGASHTGHRPPLYLMARPGSLCHLSSPASVETWAPHPRPGWTVPGGSPRVPGGQAVLHRPSSSPGGRWCVASGSRPECAGGPELPAESSAHACPQAVSAPDSLTWAEPLPPGGQGGEHSLLDGALPGPRPRQQRVTSVVPADTRSLNDF